MRIKKLDLNLIPQMRSKEVVAKRKVLSRTLEGSWTALLKGRGMEFAGFRNYTYGDDASRIDWGASLRAKDVLVREFEEYKTINALFLLDVSDTMLFSSQKKLKAEYAAEMVFNLGLSILDNGDAVGFALFNDSIVQKELPGIGRSMIYRMAGVLSNPKNYGGKKDFRTVASLVNAMLKQRALVIIVSDFISMGEGWERYIRMIAERFDLIGIMVRDPRDRLFPEAGSQFLLQDPFSDERVFVDVGDYKELFESTVKDEESYIRSVFETAKAGFVTVSTDADLYDPVLSYLRKRSAIIRS